MEEEKRKRDVLLHRFMLPLWLFSVSLILFGEILDYLTSLGQKHLIQLNHVRSFSLWETSKCLRTDRLWCEEVKAAPSGAEKCLTFKDRCGLWLPSTCEQESEGSVRRSGGSMKSENTIILIDLSQSDSTLLFKHTNTLRTELKSHCRIIWKNFIMNSFSEYIWQVLLCYIKQ